MNLKDGEVTLVKIYTSAGVNIVSFDDYQEALDVINDMKYPPYDSDFLLVGNVYVRHKEIIKVVIDKREKMIEAPFDLGAKGTRIYVDGEEYPSGLRLWNSETYGRGLRATNNSEYNFTAEDIKELKNKVEELEGKVSELTEAHSKLEKLTLTCFSEILKESVRVSNLENKRMKLGK